MINLLGLKTDIKELQELILSWSIISLSFAIIMTPSLFSRAFVIHLLIASGTAGIGIIGHELAHKYLAQRYGCSAKYIANKSLLFLSLVLSFTGLLFLAPGAVVIHNTHVGKIRHGKIAAAGPLSNLILGIFFMILFFIAGGIHADGILISLTRFGFLINTYIALFNLLPISIIDGKKILDYNRTYYVAMVGTAIILLLINTIFF